MRRADDRRQVMLAVRLEGNVLQKHDLVIAAHLAEGAAEMGRGVFLIAHAIFLPRTADTRRRIEQPLAGRVFSGPGQQREQRLLHMIGPRQLRSEEHTSDLQSLMRTSYAV